MAKGFYDLTDAIRDHLEASDFVGTVSYGDIFNVNLKKREIYSLAHFIINSATLEDRVWTFNLSLICMDLVDENSNPNEDLLIYNDNTHDVLNTQSFVVGQLIESLRRGNLYDNKFQLIGTPSMESFTDRFNSLVAGWTCTFDVMIPNEQFIC